ncbi:hypothetical protein FIV02_05220 [Pseudomonas sp. THAF187a]|nr:hypothetical protein FIV02_05220 [Pseudomonas sp. THAF187a]QFT41165.1 hypothetical protein FIU98_05210 [Pseudomonas sp. THAF42]
MQRLALVRDHFDVVLVHLPDAWQIAFRAPGFDAHDALKAIGAGHGILTQVINDRVFTFGYKASLAWRLSIALYVKAGGIPWKLAPLKGVPENTAYIGLAYALRGNPQEAHYVTCCSQVFDADGGGMQFVAFEARDPVKDVEEARRTPFLSRSDMRAVLARSLTLYQSRNGGLLHRRMVVHKTTSFKPEELEGALDALSAIREVECVEVASNAGWRGVWLQESRNPTPERRSEPDGYPVPRGAMLQRSGKSALVWVAGNAPRAASRGDYYQGGKSIPRPINIVRYAGVGPIELTAFEALALTKMDWNNDALYDPVPATHNGWQEPLPMSLRCRETPTRIAYLCKVLSAAIDRHDSDTVVAEFFADALTSCGVDQVLSQGQCLTLRSSCRRGFPPCQSFITALRVLMT